MCQALSTNQYARCQCSQQTRRPGACQCDRRRQCHGKMHCHSKLTYVKSCRRIRWRNFKHTRHQIRYPIVMHQFKGHVLGIRHLCEYGLGQQVRAEAETQQPLYCCKHRLIEICKTLTCSAETSNNLSYCNNVTLNGECMKRSVGLTIGYQSARSRSMNIWGSNGNSSRNYHVYRSKTHGRIPGSHNNHYDL